MGKTGTGQPFVSPEDIVQRRWEQTIDADRVTLIDSSGNVISALNPLPTSATISISGGVTVGGQMELKDGGGSNLAAIDANGALSVKIQDDSGNIASVTNDSLNVNINSATCTQAVSGTINAIQSGNWTVTSNVSAGTQAVSGTLIVIQPNGTNLHIVVDSGDLNVLNTVAVSGTIIADQGGNWNVTANAGSGTFDISGNINAAQSGAWSVNANAGTGTFIISGSVDAVQSGIWNVNANMGTSTFNVSGDVNAIQSGDWTVTANVGAGTQAVSGTITVLQPDGNDLHVVVDSGNIDIANTVAVSGIIFVQQDGDWSITSNAGAGTFAISGDISNITGIISLPTGAATSTLQASGNAILINGAQVTQMQGYINDTVLRTARVDSATHVIKTIEYEHSEIHDGDMFVCSNIVSSLGAGATHTVIINTPDTTKWVHAVFAIDAGNECTIAIYETVTTLTDGTALTAINRNRNSATTPTITAFHTPTNLSLAGATLIYTRRFGETTTGESTRGVHEFILKQGTKYAVQITNNATTADNFGYYADWYEHTDKN